MNAFLLKGNTELANEKFVSMGDPIPEHKTYLWRKTLELVDDERVAWARKLSRQTGLRIAGRSDGRWVRYINTEALENLAESMSLDEAGKVSLANGDNVQGIAAGVLLAAGRAVAAALEQKYLAELTGGSVRRAVLSRKGVYDNEWTGRRNFLKEVAIIWPWVGKLRSKRNARVQGRALGAVLPGLLVSVVDLTREGGETLEVPVLYERQLAKVGGTGGVAPIFAKVSSHLGVLARADVPPVEFGEAAEFFWLLGFTLEKAGLQGRLSKNWKGQLADWVASFPEMTPEREPILVEGVKRLFEHAGLFINPNCREESGGLVRSTGLVDRAAHVARTHLLVREIALSGLIPEGYEAPRLDALWTQRKTGTVYRSVSRVSLSTGSREFWEAENGKAATSLVTTETLGDVRLASLLDGAAAGHLRRFMETRASVELRGILDAQAPLDPAAVVPEGIWREVRQAIFDAKIWAAHELFFGRDSWMGLSVDYRRRLRLALKTLVGWMVRSDDLKESSKMTLARPDSLIGGTEHALFSRVPYEPRHKIGALTHVMTLAADGSDLVDGAVPAYWSHSRLDVRHLPVLRSVARLLMAGRNRVARALLVGVTLKTQGSLPEVMKPLVPVDGPEPRGFLSGLESGKGVWLSRVFDVQAPGKDSAPSLALAVRLSKMPTAEFDLGILDPRLSDMQAHVSVGALRSQWAIAKDHPQLVSFGGLFWFAELALLRHGLAKQYSVSF